MADASMLSLVRVPKPINLIPVGLKEAALDSPTFRATTVHFSEQVESIEKWLDSFVKSGTKLLHEVSTLESLINGFLTHAAPPAQISEAVLDHDYTLLALKKYSEGAREFWSSTLSALKKMEANMVEPIKVFIQNDLRTFKDGRKQLEQAQKYLDNLQSRYSAQVKSKEPSSLREDAFQLHEARKLYLKASMDFCTFAPILRASLDKLLVKLVSDQWRDMRSSRDGVNGSLSKWGPDIERIRGWSREMENGERAFRRELQSARKHIEDDAEVAARPSRELEDYSVSSASGVSKMQATGTFQSPATARTSLSDKQGWLNLKTLTGKPSRTIWVRRWFFVKNGIFGWLVQGTRSGAVEESEKIGVLLCSVRPAPNEERRFCFEVLTKDTTIMLQAEAQPELLEWMGAFDVAKRKALEDPESTESPSAGGPRAQDAAFAISPPNAPEFAASTNDIGMQAFSDEAASSTFDRAATLPLPAESNLAMMSRSSFDVSSQRRSTAGERDNDQPKDQGSKLMQKLDIHRKSNAGERPVGLAGGGIASLIAASHNVLPVGPGPAPSLPSTETFPNRVSSATWTRDLPVSTLAPSTLANPPAPTNLSATAVMVNGERGIGMGHTDRSGGMPSGIMANLWGSSNWGYMNRFETKPIQEANGRHPAPSSPRAKPSGSPKDVKASRADSPNTFPSLDLNGLNSGPRASSPAHRKTISLDNDSAKLPRAQGSIPEYPNYYPLQLKTQDAQFRLLFPQVPRSEKLVLVFRATWNPNDQQEFPGRVYVTAKEIYFYSNHLGLVLITGVSLESISEVTAAPGKDCDFLFLHLKEDKDKTAFTRITVKTFLEPLRILQRRLDFLVRNGNSEDPLDLENIMKKLIKLEHDDHGRSPSLESWEDFSMNTSADNGSSIGRQALQHNGRDLRATVRVEGMYGQGHHLYEGKDVTKFKLPAQPVVYAPYGMDRVVVEKQFDISPKALFHVMFGDRSVVWQLLYHERSAQRIKQGPWAQIGQGHLRREFEYQTTYHDLFRRTKQATIIDYQLIDVCNDHLLYVITDRKTLWHLPSSSNFTGQQKIVITHVAKSKCKLAIFSKVDWTSATVFAKGTIEKQALRDLELNALELVDVITEQVAKLGARIRTNRAAQIFGHIGQQTQVVEFAATEMPLTSKLRRSIAPRTRTRLLLESAGSLFESILTSSMQIILSFLRWTWKTTNANSIILAILLLSLVINFFHSSMDTSAWWQERKAARYMSRLGVGPNTIMSRAVYTSDLNDIINGSFYPISSSQSPCHTAFQNTAHITDMDAITPYQLPASSHSSISSDPTTHATARRLRRTRQHLGSYRHDLLVAMRVVNSVERETLQAEWENWVLDESTRCEQVAAMMRNNKDSARKGGGGGGGAVAKNAAAAGGGRDKEQAREKRFRALENWYGDYCDSCMQERRRYFGGGGGAGED